MKKLMHVIALSLAACALGGCTGAKQYDQAAPRIVSVGQDGKFYLGDSAYRFKGANLWYGVILASPGQGGDRQRLARELDLMQQVGIDNIRVLVGADGYSEYPSHVQPVLQTQPGVYNDTILDGLDYLMQELERRDMRAVLYLNNSWEWSGGYGAYLDWAGAGPVPDPAADGYDNYVAKAAEFVLNDSAKAMASAHVRCIVGRTNRYTGQPYSQSPALMAWEIANEPRPFARDSVTKQAFYDWIISTAATIKDIDPNHLVATGSEGLYGCESDMDLWAKIHNAPEIDYSIIHIWPSNWGWVTAETAATDYEAAIAKSAEYTRRHIGLTDKPLVIEEFGYPRDGRLLGAESPVVGRDKYFEGILRLIDDTPSIHGFNIWGWGGYAEPAHEQWQPGDPYTGDPAQEPQGLFSVFATDHSTLDIIKNFNYKNTDK